MLLRPWIIVLDGYQMSIVAALIELDDELAGREIAMVTQMAIG